MRRHKQMQAHPWCPLVLGFVIAILAVLHWAQQSWPSSPELRVVPISGCNSQEVLDGAATIYWTSSFSDGEYSFVESTRTGDIVSGSGPALEITIQWSGECSIKD